MSVVVKIALVVGVTDMQDRRRFPYLVDFHENE